MIPPHFAYAGQFSGGLAAVALDGVCWITGARGQLLPAPSAPAQSTSCGPAPAPSVTAACRHGYIDHQGQFVIPPEYEVARDFSEGRAPVRKNGKWGFIDTAGNTVAAAGYDAVADFSWGFAAVRSGDVWGYIDRDGKIVLKPQFAEALPFGDGLAPIQRNGQYLYIDEAGREVIPGPFPMATLFVQGLAHVRLEKTRWAWINPWGRAGLHPRVGPRLVTTGRPPGDRRGESFHP